MTSAGVPVGDTTLLQRLKELDEKATPGPWEYVAGVPDWDSFNVTGSVWSRGEKTPVVHKPNVIDALAIAALRNALPAVVTALDGLLYIAGYDVAGFDAHMRPEEVAKKVLAPFVGEATQ